LLTTPQTTSRKFYNKWLYKVTLKVHGAGLMRQWTEPQILKFCNSNTRQPGNSSYNYWKEKAWMSRSEIKDIVTFLQDWSSDQWTRRIENNYFDLYTNNKEMFEQFSSKFEKIIVHRFAPDEKTIDRLNERNGKTIVGKKLPHNRYQFKAYLYPHKIADRSDRQSFVNWVEMQDQRIKMTDSVKNWFINTTVSWDRRYVLVEDEGTLMLMKMRNADVVGSVYKFEIA